MPKSAEAQPLRARVEGGRTPEMAGALVSQIRDRSPKDVLLGPAESFRWMGVENAAWSSLVRDTLRKGYSFDKQLAMRQHREMVDAYESAGVTSHFLPVDMHNRLSGLCAGLLVHDALWRGDLPARQSAPAGRICAVLRFYLEHGIPIYDMVSAGNFEGGDFNIIRPGVALVGYTDHRSEEVAARQVADWFVKEGWEIKFAPIDQFYVHIDLMVCMLNEHCAAVCLETTEDDIVDWLKAKKIEIIPASFKETMALGCNVVALGNDRVLSTAGAKDLNAQAAGGGLRGLRSRHDHVHLGRRRRPLHVPAAPAGSGLKCAPAAPSC